MLDYDFLDIDVCLDLRLFSGVAGYFRVATIIRTVITRPRISVHVSALRIDAGLQ